MLNRKGFSLIEMSVVLVIIGFILGAVTIGSDLIGNAKQKKVYTDFILPWDLAVDSYLEKSGMLLGDKNHVGKFSASQQEILDALKRYGITPPATNRDSSFEELYSGGNTSAVITLHFAYSTKLDLENNTIIGNGFQLTSNASSFPTQLAISLDTAIDGEENATEGLFIDTSATTAGQKKWSGSVTPFYRMDSTR